MCLALPVSSFAAISFLQEIIFSSPHKSRLADADKLDDSIKMSSDEPSADHHDESRIYSRIVSNYGDGFTNSENASHCMLEWGEMLCMTSVHLKSHYRSSN